jgi:hypothetical protein
VGLCEGFAAAQNIWDHQCRPATFELHGYEVDIIMKWRSAPKAAAPSVGILYLLYGVSLMTTSNQSQSRPSARCLTLSMVAASV